MLGHMLEKRFTIWASKEVIGVLSLTTVATRNSPFFYIDAIQCRDKMSIYKLCFRSTYIASSKDLRST